MYKLHREKGVIDLDSGQQITPEDIELWGNYLAWFRDGNIPNPPDAIVEYILSIAEVKASKKEEIDKFAATLRSLFLPNISTIEMASWSIKQQKASEFIASSGVTINPILQIEASARGITVASLVNKIINKATLVSQLEATVSGLTGKHNDIVLALTTKQEVIDYNFKIGWPKP